MFSFPHRYNFIDHFTDIGIYYVESTFTYKGRSLIFKGVFSKQNIPYFEHKVLEYFNNFKEFSIKSNSKEIVFIDIKNITYLNDVQKIIQKQVK